VTGSLLPHGLAVVEALGSLAVALQGEVLLRFCRRRLVIKAGI